MTKCIRDVLVGVIKGYIDSRYLRVHVCMYVCIYVVCTYLRIFMKSTSAHPARQVGDDVQIFFLVHQRFKCLAPLVQHWGQLFNIGNTTVSL